MSATVTDCPNFSFTDSKACVIIYSVNHYGKTIEAVGDPDNGAYEYIVRDYAGHIVMHSDEAYGCPGAALRAGLNRDFESI